MAIFTHVTVGANDLQRANTFYTEALGKLGVKNLGPLSPTATLYGTEGPEFVVLKPGNGEPACHANGGTISFAAPSREAVRQFHAAGLANGGKDEGAPGPRTFTPTAYAAYLRDPEGNKICAYCFNAGE